MLCLVRHAAAAGAADGSDIHRPLSADGHKQARRTAVRLAARNLRPDVVVSSPADRAMETATLVAEAIGLEGGRIRVDDRIYDASEMNDLLEVVRSLDDEEVCVMLVGHQPVIGELALHLAPSFPGAFPRAAAAFIALDVAGWSGAGYGIGELLWFEAP
jgi:phosphohistidine phosphatase